MSHLVIVGGSTDTECCHFELDRRGGIIDYQPRCHCCTTKESCTG